MPDTWSCGGAVGLGFRFSGLGFRVAVRDTI